MSNRSGGRRTFQNPGRGLRCPRLDCIGSLRVAEKNRPLKKEMKGMNVVRRRVYCDHCDFTTFTIEILEEEMLRNYQFVVPTLGRI